MVWRDIQRLQKDAKNDLFDGGFELLKTKNVRNLDGIQKILPTVMKLGLISSMRTFLRCNGGYSNANNGG